MLAPEHALVTAFANESAIEACSSKRTLSLQISRQDPGEVARRLLYRRFAITP